MKREWSWVKLHHSGKAGSCIHDITKKSLYFAKSRLSIALESSQPSPIHFDHGLQACMEKSCRRWSGLPQHAGLEQLQPAPPNLNLIRNPANLWPTHPEACPHPAASRFTSRSRPSTGGVFYGGSRAFFTSDPRSRCSSSAIRGPTTPRRCAG